MSQIKRLMDWYSSNCNGDWEHYGGISILTVDNPGWTVTVDFDGVNHSFKSDVSKFNIGNMDNDEECVNFWYDDKLDRLRFFCSTNKLEEGLRIFLDQM